MTRAARGWVALLAVVGLGAVVAAGPTGPWVRATHAAWIDDATLAAAASAAEFFGCQQGPVVVTTLEPSPAQTVTVTGIDEECAGAEMTVRVFDERLGAVPSQFPILASFEAGLHSFEGLGGSQVERSGAQAQAGQWSLRSFGRTQTFEGPGRDVSDLVEGGQTYVVTVWVYHEQGSAQPFQLTGRQTFAGGTQTFTPVANAMVPSGEWTRLAGEATVDPDSLETFLYIEATANATMEFFVDELRGELPSQPPVGGWVTAAGPVSLPAPTLDTDLDFHPVPGTETMEVEVEIDGHAVPATWEYEAPELVEGCTVVLAGTSTPVPGVTCRGFTLEMFNLYGQPGSRFAQYRIIFDAPGTATDATHDILFTADLAGPMGSPAPPWSWSTSGVGPSSLLPHASYSCADLPTFSARAPGWATQSQLYFSVEENYTLLDPVCGP